MHTVDYLDALQARFAVTSDNAVAAALGIRRQMLSQYRTGRSRFDEAMALKVANALEIEPETVLADMAAERTSDPAVAAIWRRVADRSRAPRYRPPPPKTPDPDASKP